MTSLLNCVVSANVMDLSLSTCSDEAVVWKDGGLVLTGISVSSDIFNGTSAGDAGVSEC